MNDFQEMTLIRHGRSVLNEFHKGKGTDKAYKLFQFFYERRPYSLITRFLAMMVKNHYSHTVADSKAPLIERGREQSKSTGAGLKNEIDLPDVIFVSPYVRTLETLEHMMEGWPELGSVEVVKEELLREIEPGMAVLYGDFEIFLTLNPDLKRVCDLEGMYRFRFPGAENGPDVRDRCRLWYESALRKYAGKKVLLVTHSYTYTALRANMGDWPETAFDDTPINVPNCAVTVYRYSESEERLSPHIDNRIFYED